MWAPEYFSLDRRTKICISWAPYGAKIFFILQAFDHEDNSDFSQWVKYPQWDRLIKILNSAINFSENTTYTTAFTDFFISSHVCPLPDFSRLAAFVSLYTCSQFQHQSWEIYREIMTPAWASMENLSRKIECSLHTLDLELVQSENSIQVTWSVLTNQSPGASGSIFRL